MIDLFIWGFTSLSTLLQVISQQVVLWAEEASTNSWIKPRSCRRPLIVGSLCTVKKWKKN